MKDAVLVLNCSVIADGIAVECITRDRTLAQAQVIFSSEKSQHLLAEIQAVCVAAQKTVQDLLGVAVIYGGERFTVSRMGIVTANALAWSQKIPICGFTAGTLPSTQQIVDAVIGTLPGVPLEPQYSKEPNITL